MDEQEKMRNRPGDFALDEPLPLGAAEPVDVIQVRADDALIATLSSTDDLHIDDPIDERLAGLLRAWREDVRAEPEPRVDVTAAMAAMAAPSETSRRQNPFGPLATAAAVLVVAFVGLGLGAHGAQPGDALWGVTKVLYSDKAKSVEAKVTVTRKLEEARQALDSGDRGAAAVALHEAERQLPVVAPEDGRQQLATQADELKAQVGTVGSAATATPSSSTTASTTTDTTTTSAPEVVPPPASISAPDTTTPPVTTTPPEPTTVTTTTEPAPGNASLPEEANPAPKAGEDPTAGAGDSTAAGTGTSGG